MFCFIFQEELYEKARGEILDEIINLSQLLRNIGEKNRVTLLFSVIDLRFVRFLLNN